MLYFNIRITRENLAHDTDSVPDPLSQFSRGLGMRLAVAVRKTCSYNTFMQGAEPQNYNRMEISVLKRISYREAFENNAVIKHFWGLNCCH